MQFAQNQEKLSNNDLNSYKKDNSEINNLATSIELKVKHFNNGNRTKDNSNVKPEETEEKKTLIA